MSRQDLQLDRMQKSVRAVAKGYSLNMVGSMAVATFVFRTFFFGFFRGGWASIDP